MVKVLIEVFKRFPEFNLAKRIYLFDESKLLKKLQKKNIKNSVKWIDDFNSIRGAPVIFFGNEFFDAIPIKQFKREKNILFERNFFLEKNNKISEIYKKASNKDRKAINSYKTLKNLRFIEFPKSGLSLLEKVINKIPLPSQSEISASEFKVPSRGYVKLIGPAISLNLQKADSFETLKLNNQTKNYFSN